MKRLSPRIQRKPSEVFKASSPESNSKACPVEDAGADPRPEAATGRASKGQLKVGTGASPAPPGEPVFISRDGRPEAAAFQQTPQPSPVIEEQPFRDEAPVEDSQTPNEEASTPEGAAAGQESRPTREEPQKEETSVPAIDACSEAGGGVPSPAPPLSSPPPEGNGVGTGSGAALEAVEVLQIVEELAAPAPSEGDKAVAANEEGELSGQDNSGAAVINDRGATGLSPAGPTKVPVLESEWVGYSERPGNGTGKPQPTLKLKTAKGTEILLQALTKPSETEPRPPESEKEPPEPTDVSEYNGPGVASLPDSYLWWNRILLGRFMSVAASGDILLATTPRALAAALFDAEDQRVSPAEAEKRFANAVAAAYKVGVMGSPARLKAFRRLDCSDGIPICVAFLELSVLAAHKMHMDEATWSSDYYSRLAEHLGVDEGANGQPVGFRTDEFESLWQKNEAKPMEDIGASPKAPKGRKRME